MRLLKLLAAIGIFATTAFADVMINATNFPDANFRNYVSGLVGGRSVITNAEIAGITAINVSWRNIESLEGIEHFTALTNLTCDNNKLTSLDVSNNTKLMTLYCFNNEIESLDLSQNRALVDLYCENNKLTLLDVSQNTALLYLYCHNNRLTSLELNTNLILFNGGGQNGTIMLLPTDVTGYYAAAIKLNNPTNLATGITYADGKITSNSKYIISTPFSTSTPNAQVVISGFGGTLNFDYHIDNCDFSEVGELLNAATCETAAQHKTKCSICGFETESKLVSVGEALGHDYGELVLVGELICGMTSACYEKTCSRCDDKQEICNPIVIDHDFSEVGTLVNAATCETAAQHATKCNICGIETESDLVSVGEALGHDYGESVLIGELICGMTSVCYEVTCSRCDDKQETCNSVVVDHDFSEIGTLVTAATCTTAAVYKVACVLCGEEHEIDEVNVGEALGHDFSEVGELVNVATCETAAQHAKKCSLCGDETEVELVDVGEALGHDFSVLGTIITPENCQDGVKAVHKAECSVCGAESDEDVLDGEDCAVSIVVNPNKNSAYGIKFARSIVSDRAEINVVAPERVLETKVVVYDAIGNIVFTTRVNGNEKITWDLRNSSGRFVANGSYLVIAELKGISGKVYQYSAKLGVKR